MVVLGCRPESLLLIRSDAVENIEHASGDERRLKIARPRAREVAQYVADPEARFCREVAVNQRFMTLVKRHGDRDD